MSNLIIHIGAHKTGTTSLQHAFDQNRAALGRAQVVYPQVNWYHFAQHRLAFALHEMRDPKKGDVPDFEREAAELCGVIDRQPSGTTVFISSEEFFAVPREQIKRLRDALGMRDVRIRAVVRRPDSLLLSIYNQNAKTPENNFQAPLRRFIEAPETLHPDMAQPRCVENWASVFGRDRMTLSCYEDGNTVTETLDALCVPQTTFKLSGQLNSSVPDAVVEIMRVSKIAGLAPKNRRRIYDLALEMFGDEPGSIFSTAERQQVVAGFESAFDKLFDSFGMDQRYRAADIEPTEAVPPSPGPAIYYAKLLERLMESTK